MATSTIKSNIEIRTGSGTTNTNGALEIANILRTETLLWVHILTGDSNAMAIPFRYANADGYWYAKVVRWDNLTTIANKAFTYEFAVLGE